MLQRGLIGVLIFFTLFTKEMKSANLHGSQIKGSCILAENVFKPKHRKIERRSNRKVFKFFRFHKRARIRRAKNN